MKAYEFPAKLTPEGKLEVDDGLLPSLPISQMVKVILLVDEFTDSLVKSQPQGTSVQQLLRFAGSIPSDDLQLMGEAIEQGCEQADSNEW